MISDSPISALSVVYIGILVVGLLLVGSSLVSLARSFTAGSQAGTRADTGRSLLRAAGFSLGVGAIVFGVVGLLLELVVAMPPQSSILWALGAGLAVGFMTQILLVWRAGRRTLEEEEIDIGATGREADVIIAVPAAGLGEIAYDDANGPIHLGARSATGRPIELGTRVVIERVSRRVAIVRPM